MKYFVLIFVFPILVFASTPREDIEVLNNGIKVILIKVSENPVISSTVVVKVGLKHETKDINGISHLLEHLMFNGTEKRTQRDLYADFDAIGCYNNASTSDHYTAYYVLTRKENFEKALEIQSDMLFHSTIPKNKIDKEKGIVIEEIRKDKMSPNFFEDMDLRKALFHGTPYQMKVIGSEKSVRALKRDTIVKYYKEFYSPKNCTILIAGDFDKAKVLNWLNSYFGNLKPVKIEVKKWNLKWQKDYEKIDEPNLPYSVFYYVLKGIKAKDKLFPVQEAYVSLLQTKLTEKLMAIDPYASVSTEYTDDYGLIKFRVKVSGEKQAERVKEIINSLLKDKSFITKESVSYLKTSMKADTLFALERPHFFGMLESPFIAAGCDNLILFNNIDYSRILQFAGDVVKFDRKIVYIEGKKNGKIR